MVAIAAAVAVKHDGSRHIQHHCSAVGWLLVGCWLVVGWLLVGCWLAVGWLLLVVLISG